MSIIFSIFKLLAGVGLFMFAMYLIEESLKNLSGRNFKLFLKKIARNNVGAAFGGAVVTAVLQSSSMVTMMVLAFVGAGIFTIKNAMAIILGANLGTTLDSWIVATLGFNMDIEVIAYPAIFVGGILLLTMSRRMAIKYISFFLLGFGLLFIGLAFMKSAMEVHVQYFDFAKYASMPLIFFLLVGFGITLLVQSSSVTMALTLSALHFGAVDFLFAAAVVLGSETGTTVKIMLSALDGNAAKKRVVLGNIIFNLIITIFAFAFLRPIVLFITDSLQIKDPLICLVTFSTFVNLSGVLLFIPVLGPFTNLLLRFFKQTNGSATSFVGQARIEEPESALDLFQKEAAYFLYYSLEFNRAMLAIDRGSLPLDPQFVALVDSKGYPKKNIEDQYEYIKQMQGEIQSFYLRLRSNLAPKQYSVLNQYIASIRSAMHSVKCLHDIETNISNMFKSTHDLKYNLLLQSKSQTSILYTKLFTLMQEKGDIDHLQLMKVYHTIYDAYTGLLNTFYKEAQAQPISDIDMTVLINFNRELYGSNISLLVAVKDFILNETEAGLFNERIHFKV
ncbi:MAG: Na/Pi cotransporter family protein [Bacteroidetes bacterium]|nr:Na/Pi cotransporter family protein [Bacteroidota bacterium]